MRFAVGLVLVAALGAVGCKKNGPPPTTSTETGSGPGSAVASGSAAGSATGSAGSPGSAAAPVDPKAALDAAIKAEAIADKLVTKRAVGAHSAWALVISKTGDDGFIVQEYTVMRASPDGVAEVHIPARGGGENPALDKDVDTFEVRDIDGDGHDECLTVLKWQLDHSFPYAKGCKKCEYGEGEGGKQLYVIGDKSGGLAIAFTHLVEYSTLSQPESADDPDPPPEEKVAYDWKVEGSPPVVTLTRTDDQLNKQRPKELLDPATDPLLSAGSGAAIPLVLK